MYDAVYLFAKALHDLDASQQIDINPINCDSTIDTFSHGFSLINYMKVVNTNFRYFDDISVAVTSTQPGLHVCYKRRIFATHHTIGTLNMFQNCYII